ncbi:Nuclear pore NIC96 [Hyphodiscus hymeniophilus]|uniref:Nuclear pore NIC96 n=1 Tax=Hyphodiscus hymeniophilus TaxID=353542 RepID=A0A9P7AW73_9HELO|nr:Nuclear pore NIC96 [Hyphodiscus hymeniophilus]
MSSVFGNLGANQQNSSLFGMPNAAQPAPASNLFSGLNKPTTTSGAGLFGNTGSSAQQQQQTGGGGLFGSSSTTQPQTTQGGGGLFSGLGAQTQPQQQQNTSNLFGGLSSAQAQPQQTQSTSNIFGGIGGAQSQPQQQQRNGSVLGGQQQQQNGSSSLDGGGFDSRPPQQNAYFDTILERSRKRALGDTVDDDFPQLQLGLGDLRERIKRLASSRPDQSVDGKAHYLLAASGVDPGAAVRDLNQFTSTSGRVDKTQSQEIFDTDIEGYLSNIQTQTTLSMISDSLAQSVRDFDSFLEDNVTMEWDAQRSRVYQHFGITPRENAVGGGASFAESASGSQGAFGRSRRSKAASLAGSRAPSKTLRESTFGKFNGQKSVIGAAGPLADGNQPLFADVEKSMDANGIMAPGPSDRFRREKQSRLAEKVQSLNEARLQKRCYPILHEFAAAARLSPESHTEKMLCAYGSLIEITREKPEVYLQSDPDAVKERHFASGYLDEAPNAIKRRNVRKRILRGSTRYLEKQFYEKLEANVAKAPREANLGGIPTALSKIKAYVRLKAARKDLGPDNSDLVMLNDDYVWPLVFFLLRSGHVKEAAEYVSDNNFAFRNIDRNFTSYITSYAASDDRTLNRDMQNRINNEYNQRSRVAPENSVDPYKMACYKVIGRCDIQNRNLDGMNIDMEDFMWLQFILARETQSSQALASEAFTLTSVQTTIKELGSRFFAKNQDTDFATYFWLLIMGGLFEEAIAYLLHFSHTDAVHVAIALDFYGLLRVSDPNAAEDDFLSHTTTELPKLDFGRMVGYYTRDFRAANVIVAVDYLSLICLNQDLPGDASRRQVALCHEALRELVLESREFALLLGDLTQDGQRINGAIEERKNIIALNGKDDFMRIITLQAASVADDNGRTTDAVLLYHLAEEYDNVLVIMTRALSEAVNTPLGQEQSRLQPLKPRPSTEADAPSQHPRGSSLSLMSIDDSYSLAKTVTMIYEHSNMYRMKIKAETWADCESLMKLYEAKSLVEQGNWMAALDLQIIQACDVFPLQAAGNANEIRSYATKFSSFSQPIANAIPNVLLWTIVCGDRERNNLMNSEFGGNEGIKRLQIDRFRQQNMDLTTYTSLLRYRLPAHLHEALARAQSE